jgi:hypothetical protein
LKDSKLIITIFLITITMLMVGCSELVSTPDKIMVYDNGKNTEMGPKSKISAGIDEKISRDDAIKIVTEMYKLLTDPSFKEIKQVGKWEYQGRVYWYVQVLREYKDGTNTNIVLPSLIGYPVDTQTGEIADVKM